MGLVNQGGLEKPPSESEPSQERNPTWDSEPIGVRNREQTVNHGNLVILEHRVNLLKEAALDDQVNHDLTLNHSNRVNLH